MRLDAGVPLAQLKVDGGASVNDGLMQFQADVLGVPVRRPVVAETTALGAAYLAGLAVGYWRDRDDIAANWALDREFTPAPQSTGARSRVRALEEGGLARARLGGAREGQRPTVTNTGFVMASGAPSAAVTCTRQIAVRRRPAAEARPIRARSASRGRPSRRARRARRARPRTAGSSTATVDLQRIRGRDL